MKDSRGRGHAIQRQKLLGHGRRPGHVQRPRTSRDASVASSTRGVLHLLSKALWPSFTREVLHLLSKALYGLALCKALWPSSTRGVLHLLGKDLWPSSTKGCCISWARPYGRFFYNAQVREIEISCYLWCLSSRCRAHQASVQQAVLEDAFSSGGEEKTAHVLFCMERIQHMQDSDGLASRGVSAAHECLEFPVHGFGWQKSSTSLVGVIAAIVS